MTEIKLSRIYWSIVFAICAYRVEGVSLCARYSLELGVGILETLCDLEFCTCHDPYGRVQCICPGEEPDEELIVTSKGPCAVPLGTTSLSIDNCKKVTVIENAFEELHHLQNLHFTNIKDLHIQDRIFPTTDSPRTVNFTNSTIPDIPSYTFTGNIHSVFFDNCYVGVIRAFAFSSINGAESIVFRDTNIANAEAQAFKKFTVNKFVLLGSQFNVIPSRFVVEVFVELLFKVDSILVDEIRTLGFKIYNPKKVILVKSIINKLQGEAFKIVSRGEIVIDSNLLNAIDNEAFRGITVERSVFQQNGKQRLKFQNQTITNFQAKSLYFNRSNLDIHISKLMIDEACTCDGLILWKDMITIGKKPIEPIEVELEPIWCHMDDRKEGNFDYVPAREFYRDHCTKVTVSIYFFVIIITTTAVSIAITISIIVCILRRRKKWQPVPVTAKDANRKIDIEKKDLKKVVVGDVVKPETMKAIIVPDGRTYKETEFHIIVEKAEPLDEECVPCTVVRDRSRSKVN